MDSRNEDHDMCMCYRNDACRCDCQHGLDINGPSKFQMLGGFNVVLTVLAQEPSPWGHWMIMNADHNRQRVLSYCFSAKFKM